jgi:hypothetical protein
VEPEQEPDHPAKRLLLGAAVAGDRLLDQAGRILMNGQSPP